MRIFLAALIIFTHFFAWAQPRPVGTKLTDADMKIRTHLEIIELEGKALTHLNTHISRCQSSIEKSRSIIEWLATYDLLDAKFRVEKDECQPNRQACLTDFSPEASASVLSLLKTKNYANYLVTKGLSSAEAEQVIRRLKQLFKIIDGNEAPERTPQINRS